MGLTIAVGETRPVLGPTGQPVPSSTQTGLPYGPGMHATIHDQDGNIVCTGNSVGTVPFIVYSPGGVGVQHEVTVIDGVPFDWSLGDPI
jgi:hypothetical protein